MSKRMYLGPGCAKCPVKGCDTVTYRGSRCASLRDKYGLDDPDEQPLTALQICMLHNQKVHVHAPSIPEIDGKDMVCDGSRKTVEGGHYVILDNEEYSYILFVDGTIELMAR